MLRSPCTVRPLRAARSPRAGAAGARCARTVLALLLVAATGACAADVTVGEPREEEASASAPRRPARPRRVPFDVVVDARSCGDADEHAPPARCGPAVTSPRFALGVCGDLSADAPLTVDARPASASSDVLVAGRAFVDAPLHVAGSLEALVGLDARAPARVRGSVRSGGDWRAAAPADVEGSALLRGRLDALETVRIAGEVRAAAAAPRANVVAGEVSPAPAAVGGTLACARAPRPQELARRLAAEAPSRHARAAAAALAAVEGSTHLTLGCGTYVVPTLVANAPLEIVVQGRVALVVEGEARLEAPVHVRLVPGASLDLVVGGDLRTSAPLTVDGDAGARGTWLGVGGQVELEGPMQLEGWLVAPSSSVRVGRRLELAGAALVGALRVEAPLAVRDAADVSVEGCVDDGA